MTDYLVQFVLRNQGLVASAIEQQVTQTNPNADQITVAHHTDDGSVFDVSFVLRNEGLATPAVRDTIQEQYPNAEEVDVTPLDTVRTDTDGESWADVVVDNLPAASVSVRDDTVSVSVYNPKMPEDAAETFEFDRATVDSGGGN